MDLWVPAAGANLQEKNRCPMLEYFPTNYVWNLSVNLALSSGANIGEVDTICRGLVAASEQDDESATEAFFQAWCRQADALAQLAEEDLTRGRALSAGEKFGRAAVYYLTAERMQHPQYEPRSQAYRKMLDCFSRYLEAVESSARRVTIPYGEKSLAGVFVSASRKGTPVRRPCVVLLNGLDSTKEMIFGSGIQRELARRGVSSLAVDQPGVGEALRLDGMTAIAESEVWCAPIVDYLEGRDDVDSQAIGVAGWSLGGYYAPRAAAMEKRFKLCVAWGAVYDLADMQRNRGADGGQRSVPHLVEHIMWSWGLQTFEDMPAMAARMNLRSVAEEIRVPFLITHGGHDRQVPVDQAHQVYAHAINSPKRDLKIFSEREGGVEHCSADNMSNARAYMADWIAETFSEFRHGDQ